MVTYTIESAKQIVEYFVERLGCVPNNVTVLNWYSFLLRHCIRPYQNILFEGGRVSGINLVPGVSSTYTGKADVRRYYFDSSGRIFTDKMGAFVVEVNERSHGLVVNRLEGIYDRLYVDEVQDIAGYDLLVLEELFRSKIEVYAVGDPRQATYATNMAPKYKKYRGKNIADLFSDWKNAGICTIEEMNTSYRSNQILCDFADALYPEMSGTVSVNHTRTGHDGVFLVHSALVPEYYSTYLPRVLRYDKRSTDFGLPALNFGMAKGTTSDRVLIVPTKNIEAYLTTGDTCVVGAIAKLYVAITRARHSVAFVFNGDSSLPSVTRYKAHDSVTE